MFIDYVTLMLVNISAAFFLLAAFTLRADNAPTQPWAPVFLISGAIALITGFRMTFTWPLPGSYNIAFGELSVLFGGLMATAAWHLAKGWDLRPLSIYAFFAGIVAFVTGAQFLRLGLSQMPVLTGIGFLLAGIAAVGSFPLLRWNTNKSLRFFGILVLLLSSAIWAWIGTTAYWAHIANFMKR